METNLLRLIDLDKVDILLEGFNKSTGFVTAILDLKGNIYSKSGWRQICTEFHRINPETSKRCTISDTELAGKIADGEKYHFYNCLNGLVDVAVPIIINGQHIANLFSGQFFLEKPDYLFFKNQAAKYGFDENRYMEALEKVPVVSKEKVLVAMDFLQNMTQLISEMTFQKLEQTELNKALKESEERFKSIFNNLQDAFFQADLKGNFTLISPSAASMYGYLSAEEMIGMPAISLYADHTVRDSLLKELSAKEGVVKDFITLAKRNDNSTFWVSMNVRYLYNNGKIIGTEGVVRDITERKKSEEELKRIEWLLTRKPQELDKQKYAYIPPYGDLVALNTNRLILDSVGEQILYDVVGDYLNLLDTSSAVYEKNGDYALGIFSSGWCRFMDAASRAICDTNDNLKALDCGQWHCHESCWSRASKRAIETGLPIDIDCDGGIRLYAVPIRVGDEIVGAINFGYGEPPRDEIKLRELANKYNVNYEELRAHAINYESRPPYIIDLAKHRLMSSAHLIGEMTKRKQTEEALRKSEENLSITLNSIGDGVISTDINGLIVQMNPIAEQLCGWRLAESLGRPLSEVFKIINAQTRQPVIDPVKKVLQKGEIEGLANHTVLISRYGKEYQISDSAAPIKNKNNEITGVVLVFSDISDKYAAELALKESEERYKALHNASFGGITIHDKGKIIECNQGLSEITGYSYEELIGMDGLLLISPDTRDLVLNNILAGYEKPYEALGLRKNGDIFPLRLEARNVPYKGKVVRTVEFRDITETKQSELQIKRKSEEVEFHNQRLESLLEISQYQTNSIQELLDFALNEAIVLTNSKIGYIYFYDETNKQFILNTWSKDVMQECKVMDPQTIYDLDKTGCWGEAVKQRKPIIINDYQAYNPLKKGTPEGHVSLDKFLTIPVFSDNRIVAVAGVANKEIDYDSSDVRQLSLLMDSVWKISERISLIKALTIAKEKAEESDRLKSAFLANMSHEIRTPMNGILGFAELLKEPGLSGEEHQDYIRIIEKSGAYMLSIINDIVDISKIEAGLMKTVIQESNVNEQIEYTYNFFKPEVEAKGIELICKNSLPAKEATIKTDREKVQAILTNLVKNAIKYTNDGTIEFGCFKKDGYLEFYVKDTGIGVPKGRQEAIFERFIQAEIEDIKTRQGSGLGLAISKSYIEMLGGKIWLKSEEGNGSTFYFTLPYNSN